MKKVILATAVVASMGAAFYGGLSVQTAPPATTASGSGAAVAPVARPATQRDACAPLLRRLRGRTLADHELNRLLKNHKACRAFVIDSRTPKERITVAAAPITRVVPAPAPAAPAPATSYEDEDHESDDDYEDEGYEGEEYEEEDDD